MAARPAKTLPEERRRAESGLSEFAAYVERQQQAYRFAGAANAAAYPVSDSSVASYSP